MHQAWSSHAEAEEDFLIDCRQSSEEASKFRECSEGFHQEVPRWNRQAIQ